MSEKAKQPHHEEIVRQTPETSAGILKSKEQEDLENRIVDTLKSLSSKLTKKEIIELMSRVEVSKGLDGLKKELEKEKKLGGKELGDDILSTILDLIRESKEIAQKGIEELKIELGRINVSKVYEADKRIYFTSKFPWIRKFEESEFLKNPLIDLGGICLGLADSAQAVFVILLGLIADIFLLPRDISRKLSKRKQ